VENRRQSNSHNVGFTADSVEQTSGGGFQRRNTPHCLKQSRVGSGVSSGQDAGDRLRQMIADNPSLIQPTAAPVAATAHDSTSEEEESSEVCQLTILRNSAFRVMLRCKL